MDYRIAAISGDGIGPEIVAEAKKVLNAVGEKYGHTFTFTDVLMGGCSIDAYGTPLTDETLETCRESDAVLLGAIGGKIGESDWYDRPPQERPEAGLLALRKGLGLFTNLCISYLYKELAERCPLRQEVVEKGFDMVMVRELTGGLYFGEKRTEEKDGVVTAVDTLRYSDWEIRRIAEQAFRIAQERHKNLISVDKANVLDTSLLWRKVVEEVAEEFPDVTLQHMLVDNCAMQLVHNPGQFDVVLTENMFGDILSDEASEITGSIGMQPSASLAEGTFGLYEPSHGSAPDIAGQNIANPLATILSTGLMLRYSFGLAEEADAVEDAVRKVLADGLRTPDLWQEGDIRVSTTEMGDAVAARV